MPALPPLPPLLSSAPAATWARVAGVFTDIDDTLTQDGAMMPASRQALAALAAAGVPVVAITGRPMGWSQAMAREEPLAAVVAENGAVMLWRDGSSGALHTAFAQDNTTRAANAHKLAHTLALIEAQVPGARRADDSAGRITDIAIDHSEFSHLRPEYVARVVALMQAAGMTATVSSIHINGWFGSHSKWSGAVWAVQTLFGRDLLKEVERWVYVGDSTNDQLMFQRFGLGVGVANLLRFGADLDHWPAYLTAGERGDGFAEVAQAVLAARRPQGTTAP